MQHILNYSDVDKLFHLVMILFVFYIAFAYQNIFDIATDVDRFTNMLPDDDGLPFM